jgi:glycerol-3-phosphate dehydrogenase (NAD(P)+)
MSSRKPNVAVLGGGSWGTTVASICARNTRTVLWSRNETAAEEINTQHTNSRYLGDLPLTEALRSTADIAEAVVAGPNIAREVVQGFAAAATIAMPDHGTAQMLQPLFGTSRFRVYTTTDVVGVEVAGALKNVFAIATGIGDGLNAGDNTRAMVITRSLRELAKLGTAMGGQTETFAGLAGMGDLIATCTSPHSRNRRVGIGLAEGKTVEQVCAEMGQVAEGVKTSGVVVKLSAGLGVDMPIANEMDAVLNNGQPVEDAYRGLLRQRPGHEVHGDAW